MKATDHLLPRQKAFCDGIAAGLSGAESARRAGYSEGRAKRTASRLRTQANVMAGIKRRKAGYISQPRFDDPLEFLLWCMNDPETFALKDRIRIAATLMRNTLGGKAISTH